MLCSKENAGAAQTAQPVSSLRHSPPIPTNLPVPRYRGTHATSDRERKSLLIYGFSSLYEVSRMRTHSQSLVLVIGALLSFLPPPVSSSCVNPAQNTTCLWYPNCLEAAHACGPEGYAISYGQRYCDAFSSAFASNLLTLQGQIWRDKTLLCLQEQLVPFLNVSISCKVSIIFFLRAFEVTTFRIYDRVRLTRMLTATSRRGSAP